jgi:hypothetical protein
MQCPHSFISYGQLALDLHKVYQECTWKITVLCNIHPTSTGKNAGTINLKSMKIYRLKMLPRN